MKKMPSLKIELPNPCHEDWDKMTKAEKGRFCGSCEKIVVDFTLMTDKELIDFFITKNQRACGRFRSNQLDRQIVVEPEQKPRWWPSALAASVFSFLAVAGFSQELKPGKTEISVETELEREMEQHIVVGEAPMDIITIAHFKGTVLDQKGNRIGFAKIKIHDFDTTIVAEADGTFDVHLDLNEMEIQTLFNARITSLGYKPIDVQLPAFGEHSEFVIPLVEVIEIQRVEPSYDQLGGVPQINLEDINPINIDSSRRKRRWFK